MRKETKFKIAALGVSSFMILAGCGGGDDAPPPEATINAHYFVGKTKTNGEELWKSDGTASGTVLVKDINTHGSSYPANFTEVGDTVYFSADDVVHGTELWKSDGSGPALVKDINPDDGSNPQNMVALGDTLYFTANDGTSNQGLWQSNGSTDGTTRVGDFTGVGNLVLMPADNSLYFTTGNGSVLWKYDGVTVPTAPVMAAGSFTDATRLTPVGSTLFFIANSGFGFELWSSNATTAETVMVIDLCLNACSGMDQANSRLYDVGGTLFFTDINENIYSSDGTAAQTVLLTDTNAANLQVYNNGSYTGASNGLLYFLRSSDRAVWRTDGTPAGTIRVTSTFVATSIAKMRTASDGYMYFQIGSTLWKSDGSLAGTGTISGAGNLYSFEVSKNENLIYAYTSGNPRQIISIMPNVTNDIAILFSNSNYSNVTLYTGIDNLYFAYDDSMSGNEPWASDGTAEGTAMLGDVNSLPTESSYPYDKAILNGTLYFVASGEDEEQGLWKTDGTEEGTVQLGTEYWNIRNLTVSGGKLYFVADDDDHGDELWVTDGSESGTKMVVDLMPGDNSSNPWSLVDVNGTLYFIDGEYGFIWKTTGTVESTLPVSGIISPYTRLVVAGSNVYFVYDDDTHGDELWVTDGTFQGTKMVKDIYDGSSDGVRANYFQAAAIGEQLYFSADNGDSGRELWVTNGTEAGTRMVIDLNASDDGLDRYDQNFLAVNDQLYFMAYNVNEELELWKTDGSTAGTVQLTSLDETGGYVDYNNGYAYLNGYVYFAADNSTDGTELWKSNGTAEGTVMVKNINPTGSSSPYGFGIFDSTLFFVANDGTHGYELWKSNGTEEGTVMIKDIAEGADNGAEPLDEGEDDEERYYR